MELKNIAQLFDICAEVTAVKPVGNGLINDTYKVDTTAGEFVLQRINDAVFKDVDLLQANIEAVTDHIRSKGRQTLHFIRAKATGKTYAFADNAYWRVADFIKDAVTKEAVTTGSSRDCGRAFGEFEAMLTDLGTPLGETIPDFHNIELRVRQMEDAVAADAAGRLSEVKVQEILADLRDHAFDMCLSERLYREGKIAKRICHCDTKVNNMMFAPDGKVLCVIDLDTTMPSFVFSDYGDFLRSAANFVAEDDPAIEKVGFNMEIFEAFTEGYLQGTSSFLTPLEKSCLPYAACLFPYMQAVRFLTDYLNGDTYYKIKYPEHNFVRTCNQLALFHSALSNVDRMTAFIGKMTANLQ